MGIAVAYQIYTGFEYFFSIVSGILFVYCIMTWFVRPSSPIYAFMNRLVEPIVMPFRPLARKLMEKGLMLDVSVLLAIFGVQILRKIVSTIMIRFFF